jgi:hypothetical protein
MSTTNRVAYKNGGVPSEMEEFRLLVASTQIFTIKERPARASTRPMDARTNPTMVAIAAAMVFDPVSAAPQTLRVKRTPPETLRKLVVHIYLLDTNRSPLPPAPISATRNIIERLVPRRAMLQPSKNAHCCLLSGPCRCSNTYEAAEIHSPDSMHRELDLPCVCN